eukprot:2854233-Rhodomonas_salina.2
MRNSDAELCGWGGQGVGVGVGARVRAEAAPAGGSLRAPPLPGRPCSQPLVPRHGAAQALSDPASHMRAALRRAVLRAPKPIPPTPNPNSVP